MHDLATASAPTQSSGSVHALSQYAVIRVSGADAATFLQAQLSNDITELGADRAQLSSLCTPQGRVLAILLIWRQGEELMLMLPDELAAPIVQRLQRYVLRAAVIIEPARDIALLGISGKRTNAAMEPLLHDRPLQVMETRSLPGGRCIALRGDLVVLALASNAAIAGWDLLSERLPVAGGEQWDLQRIRAGVPMVTLATQEAFVPQMLNLEKLGAISFTKGCYPGQEIVARAQYRGEVKRRLFRLRLAEGSAADGQDIYTASATGKVVNAVRSPDGSVELLAVLPSEAADGASLRLGTMEGPQLKLLA
jgi:folate-binding protein YgfZ